MTWDFWTNADEMIRVDRDYRKSRNSDFPGNVERLFRYGMIADECVWANETFEELSAIGQTIHPPGDEERSRSITRSVTAAAIIAEITPSETSETIDGSTYDAVEMVRRSSIMAWWVTLFKHNLNMDSHGVIRRNDLTKTVEGTETGRSMKLTMTYYPTAAACDYISQAPSTEVAQALSMPHYERRTKWLKLVKSVPPAVSAIVAGIVYTPFLGLAASIPSLKDKLVLMLDSIADQYRQVVLNSFSEIPECQSIMAAMNALTRQNTTMPSFMAQVQKVLTDVQKKLKPGKTGRNKNDRSERGLREADQNAAGQTHHGKNRRGVDYDQHRRSRENDYDENSGRNGNSPRYQKNNTSRGQKTYHKNRDNPERYREQSPRPKQSGQNYDRGVRSPKRESTQSGFD